MNCLSPENLLTWADFRTPWKCHPWCQRRDIVAYCKAHDIVVQAYWCAFFTKPALSTAGLTLGRFYSAPSHELST